MAREAEQFVTPERMLGLVEPFGISFEEADVPNLQWWDSNQEWNGDKYDRVTDEIFTEQYGNFTEAVRTATPGTTEKQTRIWTASSDLGSLSIAIARNGHVSEDPDEFASWMSGPFHSMTIEGPAKLKPVEGLITVGATQRISITASQHRWDTHPADSGRGIETEFKLALPKHPKLEVREADGDDDTAKLFVASVKPTKLKTDGTIRGSDGLLSATALAVKVMEQLDPSEGKVKR